MIWADRLIVFWALLCILFFFWLGGGGGVAGFLTYPYALFLFIGVPWIILRTLDWLFGGPTYRRLSSRR
jgi:hypothetical protein